MIPDRLRARVLGGYVVLPVTGAIRSVTAYLRVTIIRAAIVVLRRQVDELETLLEDTAIELHDAHNMDWLSVGRRCGWEPASVQRRVAFARRRQLTQGRETVDVVSDRAA